MQKPYANWQSPKQRPSDSQAELFPGLACREFDAASRETPTVDSLGIGRSMTKRRASMSGAGNDAVSSMTERRASMSGVGETSSTTNRRAPMSGESYADPDFSSSSFILGELKSLLSG